MDIRQTVSRSPSPAQREAYKRIKFYTHRLIHYEKQIAAQINIMDVNHTVADLKTALQVYQSDIAFAYVFGSLLTRYYRPGKSDIDLGIYFRGEKDIFQIIECATAISNALDGCPKIDIVQMNTSGLIINHQIFQHGQLIMDNDEDLHTHFFLVQQSMYVDFKRSRRVMEEAFNRPILKHPEP